jgi:dihydroorotate dehydrogenase
MYKAVIRPVLFLFPPEMVHHLVVSVLKLFLMLPGGKALIKLVFQTDSDQSIELAGLTFKNHVGLAAGFDKNAIAIDAFAAFGFGFIEIGTVTPRPQPGNPKPRSFRLPNDKALINRMGINNDGADVIADRLKRTTRNGLIIGGNIGKNTLTPNNQAVDDYVYCFRRLYEVVDYFVVNVSCPNVSDMKELQDQKMLEQILSTLVELRRQQTFYRPVLLKISPDLNYKQLDEVIEIFFKTGIDGFVVSNTTVTRDNLKTPSDTVHKIGNGGLSGRPLNTKSTTVIKYIYDKSDGKIPMIGVGGIFSPDDAREKIIAGAKLIQIYTGFIYEGPALIKRIAKRMSR